MAGTPRRDDAPLWPTGAGVHPFKAPHRLAMGMTALHPGEPWFVVDADHAADLREKDRLLSTERPQVCVETPSSRPAQREIRDAIADHLCRGQPALFERRGDALWLKTLREERAFEEPGRTPLECAARWVQEDLCVMERDGDTWVLSAACVCFPTRWDLPSKLSLPLRGIHDPVPGYGDQLGRSADRFFEVLKVERTFWRNNWALTDSKDLFQPGGHSRARPDPSITADNAGERVWIRVEHQTLHRFPRTDAVLFTIRVHRIPLRELRRDPEAARTLVAALRSMDPALHRYKSLPPLHEAVVAFLS